MTGTDPQPPVIDDGIAHFVVSMKNTKEVIVEAFGPLAKVFSDISKKLMKLFDDPLYQAMELAHRRDQHGGMLSLALQYPDEYMTTACVAWLHEPCKSREHDLGCHCTCHTKDQPAYVGKRRKRTV